MIFKYITASSFALLGVFASVFGFISLLAQNEAPAVVVSSDTSDVGSSENSAVICSNPSNTFTQDESQVLASEYAKTGTADCLFVGCGGII